MKPEAETLLRSALEKLREVEGREWPKTPADEFYGNDGACPEALTEAIKEIELVLCDVVLREAHP